MQAMQPLRLPTATPRERQRRDRVQGGLHSSMPSNAFGANDHPTTAAASPDSEMGGRSKSPPQLFVDGGPAVAAEDGVNGDAVANPLMPPRRPSRRSSASEPDAAASTFAGNGGERNATASDINPNDYPIYQQGAAVYYLGARRDSSTNAGGAQEQQRNGGSGANVMMIPARIVGVHFDDALDPYYTIQCEGDGTERQTVR